MTRTIISQPVETTEIGVFHGRKQGGVVCLSRAYTPIGVELPAGSKAVTLGTLPEGWRPSETIMTPVTNNASKNLTLYVYASGVVTIQANEASAVADTTRVTLNLTWIAD